MDEQVEKLKREEAMQLAAFRREFQKVEDRRDFDLIDPLSKRKEPPCRVGDDDPRIGIASLQRFEGEDLGHPSRRKLQNEQMRVWIQEQMYEKRQSIQEERESES